MSFDIVMEVDTGGEEKAVLDWHDPGNITYNIAPMWTEALGCSIREFDGRTGADSVDGLTKGIEAMEAAPEKYAAMNPENGWGNSDQALDYLRRLRAQCVKHPKATIGIY